MKKIFISLFTLILFCITQQASLCNEQEKHFENTYNEKYSIKILNKVSSPNDIKKMNLNQLEKLADDIRYAIMKRSNTLGGHLGPDLGIVEATIALHYVFDSPKDKIIYDVSHQCYPHKIITGRKDAFLQPEKHPEISGYTAPNESEHDHFTVGHTSTSISLALGMAKARDLKNEKYNVIALIGDGALSGGEAYEGLNNAAVLGSNFIIIVNDNEMSIAENNGGLYKNLATLRETNGKSENNIFKALGYEYIYVEEGNNTEKLIDAFSSVKNSNKPTVVHIHTLKGKGLDIAEQNKEAYHWITPNKLTTLETGIVNKETYASITAEYLIKKKKNTPELLVISPATPSATGLKKEIREILAKNYTDVGIAEEHAIAYASGAAKNGAKPVLEVMSSFIQRTYDQLSQDLALNNSPATILIFGSGISGADVTHLGIFDIPLISNIPNIVYLAPTTKEEYLAMLDWSLSQKDHPVAIRVPSGNVISSGLKDKTTYSDLNKFSVTEKGDKVAIIAAGDYYELGKQVHAKLYKQHHISATLINPKYLTRIDEELLNSLKENHKLIITLENGVLDGGFGEKISRFYGNSRVKVINFGAKKEFTDRVPLQVLKTQYHLTPELIVKDIMKTLE